MILALTVCFMFTASVTWAQPTNGRMLAQATEYHLTLSRSQLSGQRLVIQYYNNGQDRHNLLASRGGKHPVKMILVSTLTPGGLGTWRGRLAQGSWTLYCSVGAHRKRGMQSQLRIVG